MFTFPKVSDGSISQIAIARITRGYSVKELAHLIDIDQSLVEAWEAGRDYPSTAKLNRLILLLRWPKGMLLSRNLSPEEAIKFVQEQRRKIEAGEAS